MKRLLLILLWTVPVLLQAQLNYPATKKGTVVEDYSGMKVSDPYRWLEDDNSSETKAWVQEENKVTFSYLENIPFRNQWYSELEKNTGDSY